MVKNIAEYRYVRRFSGRFGLFVFGLVLLGGCSDVPKAVNPVEWYKSTVNVFSGEDSAAQSADASNQGEKAAIHGADRPFPNVSSVPQGLSADRQNRRYAKDEIQRQGEPTHVFEPSKVAAAPVVASEAPPPPAMPVASVSKAEIQSPSAKPLPAPRLTPPVPPVPAPGYTPGLAALAEPLKGAGVQETYTSRLSQRLPLKGGLGGAPDFKPIDAQILSFSTDAMGEPVPTVIISSAGVEKGAGSMQEALAKSPIHEVPVPMATNLPDDALSTPYGGSSLAPGAVKVATIVFDNGTASLKKKARRVLGDVYNIYRQQGGKIRVVGHSSSRTRNMDPVKHKMVNYKLSVGRADVVKRELLRLGVPANNIFVDAKSDSTPMYYETMPSGEAGNRRTEVYFER